MDTRNQLLMKEVDKFFKLGDISSAANYAKKILKKNADNLFLNEVMLTYFLQNNQLHHVEVYSDKIISIEPHHNEALTAKLKCVEAKELYFQAVVLIDKLLKTDPENLHLFYKKALNLISSGQILDAEKLLLQCEALNFEEVFLQLNLGHVYKAKGNSALASKHYLKFIDTQPTQIGLGHWSLADLKDYKFSHEQCIALENLLQSAQLSEGNRAFLGFALGIAYGQNSNYEASFKSMASANQIISKYRPFKAEPFAHLIKSFISQYNQPCKEPLELTSVQPIFIVGMPRSGTTLVEQILASHSKVATTDELPYIERIALDMEMKGGYVNNLLSMSDDKAKESAKQYLAQASNYLTAHEGVFIDKNPNNFMHIALIKRLFPKAKIINVIRDPADNAMSVYKQYFSNGHDYSYSIPGIIFYWQGYLSLMFHWKKLFNKDIYQLDYADLVEHPEQNIKKLLAYCELEFEMDCLNFHKSDRVVLTPSANQVRQPINNKSIDSWKKYQQSLTPFLDKFSQIKIKAKELVQ
ncbi:MAG: sulfotransferase [Thalassotalea sp.]|nr:sulfotransferase [Thalassotalea sp.]MDG2394567.1 sulfotransferase [Thalassotalea sp.]